MTKLDVIEVIGDVLTDLDVVIGSLLPKDPNHQKLLDLRTLLDDRQRTLSRLAFDENTARFQQAAQQLNEINNAMGETLREIDHLNDTIDNVTRLLGSATSLISTAASLAVGA